MTDFTPPIVPRGTYVKPTYSAMSQALRALTAPSRVLDGIFFRMREEVEGDIWCDLVAPDGDIWSRRDLGNRMIWHHAPCYTESLDTVLACKFGGVRISSLAEDVKDLQSDTTHPWRCELEVSGIRPEPFVGLGINPAIAVLDALCQVFSVLAGEEKQ